MIEILAGICQYSKMPASFLFSCDSCLYRFALRLQLLTHRPCITLLLKFGIRQVISFENIRYSNSQQSFLQDVIDPLLFCFCRRLLFPLSASFFLFFFPLLTFFYSAVAGKAKTAVAFLIPVLLIFLFSHLLQLNTPYLVILIMGTVGLTISAVALKNSSIEKTVIYPALIIIGAICAFFIYSGFRTIRKSLETGSNNSLHRTIEQNINLYAQLPLDQEDIKLDKKQQTDIYQCFYRYFPRSGGYRICHYRLDQCFDGKKLSSQGSNYFASTRRIITLESSRIYYLDIHRHRRPALVPQ